MHNLKDIHNTRTLYQFISFVVLSGFQWTIWRIYTTGRTATNTSAWLFYQDFNEQFEGYTQPNLIILKIINVVLSGFQWTIWRIYTTYSMLFCLACGCFIRISMNNLKDIHNITPQAQSATFVVLSGFQWTIWRIYTTSVFLLFLQR